MIHRHGHAGRLGLALIAMVLVATGWLSGPLGEAPLEAAAPGAQAQPSPAARPTNTPRPTLSPEQKVQDLQLNKLERENDLLELQQQRVAQQRDLDKQIWRAPAAAIASVGPTLVGLGLLYLLARALSHWLPPPERPRPAEEELDEDEEDL